MKTLIAAVMAALALSACSTPNVAFQTSDEPVGNVVTSTYPVVGPDGKETPNVVFTDGGTDAKGNMIKNPVRSPK